MLISACPNETSDSIDSSLADFDKCSIHRSNGRSDSGPSQRRTLVDNENDKQAEAIIGVALEKLHADSLRDYLNRGRRFGSLISQALNQAYAAAMRELAESTGQAHQEAHQRLIDLHHEHELRGDEPPDWDERRASFREDWMKLPDKQRHGFAQELISEYEKAKDEED